MSVLRPFRATDLLTFNNINLDRLYSINFYLTYLAKWPELCCMQDAPNGRNMGYVIGKAEGAGTEWHGHVTAITVAPEYRRLGLARKMMELLERISDDVCHGYFVDLFVRPSNRRAIEMYEGMGYSVWRRIKSYYEGIDGSKDEDAFDLRKPLSLDKDRKSVRSNGRDILVGRTGITM
ncbi:N-acetyltransferase [Clavulina sp. PMI_390]|nr:N-acetyltransferase [Clavulina sp. PMI_390]